MEAPHPSLLRPSMFSIAWHGATWGGAALLVWSVLQFEHGGLRAMSPQIIMIAALIILSELRPVVMPRLEGNPVSISIAFVFAAMYLWGFSAGAVLMAMSVVLSEVLQGKPWWKVCFNTGQYVLSLAAAWVVVVLFGYAATPSAPNVGITLDELWWMVLGWAVYHIVNLALVSCLSATREISWWDDFTDEWQFYTVSAASMLALSPLIAIVAYGGEGTWALLPLLLVPLLAVQKAAEMSRENDHQALHDPLTGLPNRLLLADRIDQALARSERQSGHVTVMFLDVDLFKVVNDSLGHHAGDTLLVELARRLTAALRPGDTLARFGGDEFVIACENVPDHEVEALANRIAAAVELPFVIDRHEVNVTISIGIAMSHGATDAQTLLRDADSALYKAKATGRSRAVVFDDQMHLEAAHRLASETGLRRAIERDELQLYYQPIVSIRTGEVRGMEALVRWRHPSRGLISPQEFIPIAEETGLIVPMGTWVLDHAMRDLASWRSTVPAAAELALAVNVSSRQLRSVDLVRSVVNALESTGLPPAALELELTESALVDASGPQSDTIAAVTGLGVGFAIDDFGTGYSSLAYLAQLPVTRLKIDRTFIEPLSAEGDAPMAIVDAIVSIARALRLDVVAEGVETREQLAGLRRLGAAQGQGYLWSAPIPAADVPGWLTAYANRS